MISAQIKAFIGLWNGVTIEYFGDYYPNEDEQADPMLYGSNVRKFYH